MMALTSILRHLQHFYPLASYKPKENLTDMIIFTSIVALLVLMAGLMSGKHQTPIAERMIHLAGFC